MKIIIVGSGKVGYNLMKPLIKEKHSITVVDNNAHALKRAESADILPIFGNGASTEILEKAEVQKADLVIATTPSDELNIVCCLFARKLGAKNTISRVRDPEYAQQIDLIRQDLGLSLVINPEMDAADEILRSIIFSPAARLERFGKGRVELVAHKLTEQSRFCGKTLAQTYKMLKAQFLICAVERGEDVFIPNGQFTPQANDIIYLTASHRDLEKFFKASGLREEKIRNVMIVGGGRIAYYLAKQLDSIDVHVKIIERNEERAQFLAQALNHITVVNADGTDQAVLIEEGLDRADAFVALTGIDELNSIIALYAKEQTSAKIIAKINRESYIDLAERLNIDTVVSPKYLTASSIIRYVRMMHNAADSGSDIVSIQHLVGDKVEAIEFCIVNHIENLVKVPLKDVNLKKNILIAAIIRQKNVIIPNGDSCIELGDHVIVVSKDYQFTEICDILE